MYRTGDVAQQLPDGTWRIIGRQDQQVKIRGYRIELGEIESVLMEHEAVREAAVVVEGEAELVAYIVGQAYLDQYEIRQYAAHKLPSYMVPSRFVSLSELPVTPNGKIDRSRLSRIIVENRAADIRMNDLSTIWKEILGLENIDKDQSFFMAGGDSFKAIKFIATVNELLNWNLSLKDLYQYNTYKDLVQYGLQHGAKEQQASTASVELDRFKETALHSLSMDSSIVLEDIDAIFPLSDVQMGMVFHSLKEKYVYHDQYVFETVNLGESNAAVLQEGLLFVSRKHPMLRTVIRFNGVHKPFQIILKQLEPLVQEYDLTGIETESRQREVINGILAEDREVPFVSATLQLAPLWRCNLFRLPASRYVININIHHSIYDGKSLDNMLRDLSIYLTDRAFRLEGAESFEQLENFIAEQALLKRDLSFQKFWCNYLQNAPTTSLIDYTMQGEFNARVNPVPIRMQTMSLGEQTKLIDEYTASRSLHPRAVLLTVFGLLVGRMIGRDDNVIGLIETIRPIHAQSDEVFGCFINTIPFRFRGMTDGSPEEIFRKCERMINEMKHYGRLPLYEIEKSVADQRPKGVPISTVTFNYRELDVSRYGFEQFAEIDHYEATHNSFDFILTRTLSGYQIKIVYHTNLFSDHFVSGFMKSFEETLISLLSGLKAPFEVKHKPELLPIAKDGGDHTSIHGRIAAQARRTPEATAVVYEGTCLTYGQLEEQSNQMARAFRKRGIGRGGIVGILMERSPQILIAMLGVLKAEGTYLPLDPEFPSERLAYMLEDSKAHLLIVSSETEGHVMFDGNVMRIDDEEWTQEDPSTIEASLESGRDLAYLMYTSGSTGRPKGVMIEHASVCNLIEGITERIDFSAGRTILGLTTISFDIFVLETWLPLNCGMTVILAGKRHQKDPWELGKLIEESGVQMMQATPSRMNWLMQAAGGACLRKLETIMVGGEGVPAVLVERLRKVSGARIYNMYGPTETTVWSCCGELEPGKEVTVGTPIRNTRLYVVNDENQVLPEGSRVSFVLRETDLHEGTGIEQR